MEQWADLSSSSLRSSIQAEVVDRLRKRFYILFVTRDTEGQLRKIPIPIHYLYVFLAGALIGMMSITGMAGSYARMLLKVARFNQLRTEKKDLESRYSNLEKVAHEKDIQVASLGSLASEVSALYGLKQDHPLALERGLDEQQVATSLDQLHALRQTALAGVTTAAIEFGPRNATMADWLKVASAPTLWPVQGPITGSFGERIDPFNGEGAFHTGVDISSTVGTPVIAPADGVVEYADVMSGYGRMIIVDHGYGVTTRYGHLSAWAVTAGQQVHRGDVIGYVGDSGRSTGPHLHYEVRIYNTPVNPHKYLRTTMAHTFTMAAGD